MRVTIAAKSVLTVCLLIVFSLALVGVYLERREEESIIKQVVARLEAQSALLQAEIPESLLQGDAWARRAGIRTKARVTLIAQDGRVLADSEEPSAQMENHHDRPEIAAALATGTGQAMRSSRSVNRDLLYYARSVPTAGGGPLVLRLSVPLGEVAHGFTQFRHDFLAIAALSLVLASGIAILWARRIARQLRQMVEFTHGVSHGQMPPRLPIESRDEFGDLAAALNAMAADVKGILQRLEEESHRSRTIMESMVDGLLVLDARGHISLVNPAAEKLLGLEKSAAMGRTALEMLRSHEMDDLLKNAIHQEGGSSAEITLVHPRRRILAGTAVAMRDAQGIVQGTVLALRDITQLKRLEEMRMEFVLNVSHELRTPLTAIQGYAETLLDGGFADRENAQKFLEIIHRHSERLGRLLNDLLELSNIELEKTPLHLRPVPILEIARQTVTLLTSQAEKRRIHLSTAIPEELPPVLGDRDRLVQILVNLVDNAIKYTPEGGIVTVTARVAPAEAQGGRGAVELVVTDTGIGIPQKDLPRLTERFYRVDKARSRELGGTGLGLAIVKHLVAAHGGTLSIESKVGEGTQVRVSLPAGSSVSTPSA
jgi:two-component system, OmpR family, phosphate regulon sensor histidine kinase PhoR